MTDAKKVPMPKTLAKTNPLLFSLLMAVDATKFQVNFNGQYSRDFEKTLPVFEYAVNSWNVTTEKAQGVEYKQLNQTVFAALWRQRPEQGDCNTSWTQFPSGDKVKKVSYEMDYFYDFEQWREETFGQLETIISTLFTKGPKFTGTGINKKRQDYLPDIFGWELGGNIINYLYAVDVTANQFFGVGAQFTLQSPFNNCCPKIDLTNCLTKCYFESLGFVLPEIS